MYFGDLDKSLEVVYADHMQVDLTTGEVADPDVPKGAYLRLFFTGIERILATDMTPTDYRVLFAVWLRSPIDGWPWETAPGVIAQQLDIAPTAVHKALRRLVNAGLLVRPLRGKVAFVNTVAWRGPMKVVR